MAEGETHTTTGHDHIRAWAEERGGVPATVEGTEAADGEAGILRIHFPERGDDDSLEEISWEDFFDKFESEDLAMLHQHDTAGGDESRFHKFVAR